MLHVCTSVYETSYVRRLQFGMYQTPPQNPFPRVSEKKNRVYHAYLVSYANYQETAESGWTAYMVQYLDAKEHSFTYIFNIRDTLFFWCHTVGQWKLMQKWGKETRKDIPWRIVAFMDKKITYKRDIDAESPNNHHPAKHLPLSR